MNLQSLSDNELKNLNARIVSEMRHRHNQKGREVAAAIKVGDAVAFKGHTGIVSKINRTTAFVQDSERDALWKVSLSLIKPIATFPTA